ncbi:hypothetical protein Lalb_Chr05g0212811 [Lupinus albus]|uniref:Uncharacterized protein n=1 Tax=Lupinus albus TaxID=3870 RepID=A0A6A4QHP3_LUPAL|nr:hypothetical protein Lalb_Chr05g0212811 [Lupinus albus]
MNCVKGFFSVSVGCLLQREKLAVVGVICYDIRYVLDLDILVFICFLWPEPYESGTKTHIYGGMGSLVGLFLIICILAWRILLSLYLLCAKTMMLINMFSSGLWCFCSLQCV